jgi:hypothetical protein
VSSPETGQISSFRAVRRVSPSESLRVFIRSAGRLFAQEKLDEAGSGEVEPLVFSANGLHSTLLVLRAPNNPKNNERLEKVENYIRQPRLPVTRRVRPRPGSALETIRSWKANPLPPALQEAEDLYVPDKDQLYVRASKIVRSVSTGGGRAGTELALLIDKGPVTDVLMAQSDLLHDAATRPNAYSLLPRQTKPNPRELPFMRAVFSSEAQIDEFIEALSPDLPVYDIGLRPMPISYRHEL